jgi:transcriptional regulator with XRE-family HTH domain
LVAEVIRVNSRPYSALGEVLDELARKRNVRGPHAIANYIKSRLGEAPTGTAVSKWMYGESSPTLENLRRFAEAFELSKREKITLSFAFAYGQKPPEEA